MKIKINDLSEDVLQDNFYLVERNLVEKGVIVSGKHCAGPEFKEIYINYRMFKVRAGDEVHIDVISKMGDVSKTDSTTVIIKRKGVEVERHFWISE